MKKMILMGLALALGPTVAMAQATKPLSFSDAAFIKGAAIDNLAAIQAGQLARSYGSASVKAIGEAQIVDHTAMNVGLAAVAASKGMLLPTAIDEPNVATMNGLAATRNDTSAARGHQFDKAYFLGQIAGHQNTIALYEQEASGGSDSDLKALAARELPTLKKHLAELTAASKKKV